MTHPTSLILASASTARRAVLQAAGIAFETLPAHIDEAEIKRGAEAEGLSPEDTAMLLAELKAQRISRAHPESYVLGCDQLLICEERRFDKPVTLEEARHHLQFLRNRTHILVTTILCLKGTHRLWHHIARPHLRMRDFSDAFLDDYIAREGETLLASVGAYRLEGRGIQLFDTIEGDHFSILGLPLLPLLTFLRLHGLAS